MDGSFACPECGCVIVLSGLAPGRQVRCDWCRSVVEVPYIPRADQIKQMRRERGRRRQYRPPAWAIPLVALLLIAIAFAGAARVVRSRWKSAEANAIARLVRESEVAEKAGRIGDALVSAEGAITLATPLQPPPYDLPALRERRDELSRQDVRTQLDTLDAASPTQDPGLAVGTALTLEARARKDRALAGLTDRIGTSLDRVRLRWAEADGRAVEVALGEGRIDAALDLAQRQYETAKHLPKGEGDRLQSQARAQASRIIGAFGTIIEPIEGQFTLGSPHLYETRFRPPLTDGLRRRGYLPRPSGALWDDLWNALAPYRVALMVNERQDDPYLQSANRISQIEVRLSVLRKGAPLWGDVPRGRTQVPLPRTPAYQAGRLASSTHRSPEFERLLYENALENLLERLQITIKNLPILESSLPTTPPS